MKFAPKQLNGITREGLIDFGATINFGTGRLVTYTITHGTNRLFPIVEFYGETSEEKYEFGITNRTLTTLDIWSSVLISEKIFYSILG